MTQDHLLPPFCRDRYSRIFEDIKTFNFHYDLALQNTEAAVNYRMTGDVLELSPNATYGLFHDLNGVVECRDTLNSFAVNLLRLANDQGASCVHLRLPPDGCHPMFSSHIRDIFNSLGSTEIIDFNQYVDVQLWHEGLLSRGNRKRLRQARELGLKTSQVTSDEGIREGFGVLKRNRETRSLHLSMDGDTFIRSKTVFPNDYLMYATYCDDKIVACAALIRLSSKRLYVFMWGHEPSWSTRSPVVPLFVDLMSLCAEQQIETLDLGISSVNGQLDPGLARFKTGLGAASESKRTLNLALKRCYART